MTAVLEGVRVLDFGRFIAGPFCAALLGDLGADVIRIERVDGGEDRVIASVGSDAVGAVYLQSNRNKRGLTLNPATAEGREITRRLVEGADVYLGFWCYWTGGWRLRLRAKHFQHYQPHNRKSSLILLHR